MVVLPKGSIRSQVDLRVKSAQAGHKVFVILPWFESGLSNRQLIDFEVSVNAVEKEGSEAKLNVVAAVVGGGVKGDSSSTSSHTAKLSFKVPVEFKEGS